MVTRSIVNTTALPNDPLRPWPSKRPPEAKAAEQADFNRRAEEAKALWEIQEKAEAQARAERERQWMEAEAAPIKAVEINSATELQLANLQGLSADVARQIVTERAKGKFKDWGDVVQRVVGLSAAETIVRASAFGLTVNGSSLKGAEPNSTIARYERERWRRRNE